MGEDKKSFFNLFYRVDFFNLFYREDFFNLFYREDFFSIYFIENNFFWLDGLYIEKLKNKYKYNILGAD